MSEPEPRPKPPPREKRKKEERENKKNNNGNNKPDRFEEAIKEHIIRRSGATANILQEKVEKAIKELFPFLTRVTDKGEVVLTPEGQKRKELIVKQLGQERQLSLDDEENIIYGSQQKAWETVERLLSEIYSNAFLTPNEAFQATMGNLEFQMRLVAIKAAVLASKNRVFLSNRMSEYHQAAEVIHNASYIVYTNRGKAEDMARLMQVPSTVSDAILKMDGVPFTYRIYADYFHQKRMENLRSEKRLDWIDPRDAYVNWRSGECAIDKEVRETLILAIENGVFSNGRKYSRDSEEFKKDWPDWKIDRAVHYGRAYGAATAVLVEIAGELDLPENNSMVSPFAEDFARIFGPVKHLVDKFGVGNVKAYIYYLFTGDMREFSSLEEIDYYFHQVIDPKRIMKMPKEKRDKIPNFIWNLTGIDSRSGGWRLKTAAGLFDSGEIEKLTPSEKQKYIRLLGLEVNLEDTGDGHGKIKEGKELQKALRHNQEIWDLALKRTPLAVLRGLLRVNPELQTEINDRFFKEKWFIEKDKTEEEYEWVKGEKKLKSRREYKVKVADEEHNQKIQEIERWLLILKEDAIKNKQFDLNFELVPENLREDVKRYRDTIREVVWEKGYLGGSLAEFESGNQDRQVKREWLVDKNGDMKKIFPHCISISDIPFENFEYARTGSVGNLGRRWRDINAASVAKDGFLGFLDGLSAARKPGDYVHILEKVYNGIKDFDLGNAQEFTAQMLKMISLANKKLWGYEFLPAPLEMIPSIGGLFPRPTSLAQKIFGTDAPSWDKVDIWNFIEFFGDKGLINSLGENNAKERLIKELKVDWQWRFAEFGYRYGPLAAVLIIALVVQKLIKEILEENKN